MFFILSKVLDFLISPLVWSLILFFVAVISKNQIRKRKYFVAGFIVILFFTNPLIVNSIFSMWEIKAYSTDKINDAYDVGIVMGGASRYYNTETKRLVYGGGIDRVIQAVELYHQKKIKKILLTGGSGFVLMQDIKEADLLKDLLLNMHIPDSDIIMERQSRNTYENAKMSADLLKSDLYGKRYLVITSAFHIPRTMACFNKQGIKADPFPVDEHAGDKGYTPEKLIIPGTGSLSNWEILFHEWMGMLIYKLEGYA